MTRVATFTSRQMLIARMNELNARLHDSQVQVATEKKSQTYSGIATDSFRLLNFESETSRVQSYLDNNAVAMVRLNTMEQSIDSASASLKDFRQELIDFTARDPDDWTNDYEQDFKNVQGRAFAVMKDIEYFMNANLDGRYLFSGAKSGEAPVQLPFDTLEDFQAMFDGGTVTFPESRAANLSDAKFNVNASFEADSTATYQHTVSVGTGADTFDLDDTTDDGLIDPNQQTGALTGQAGDFAGVTPGMTFEHPAGTTRTVQAVSADGSQVSFTPPLGGPATTTPGPIDFTDSYGAITGAAGDFITATLTEDDLFQDPANAASTLTFNPDGTITSDKDKAFSGLSVGMTVLIDDDGSTGANDQDGIYTITRISPDGRSITVEPPPPGDGLGNAVTADPTAGDPEFRIGLPEGTRIKVAGSTDNDGYFTVSWPDSLDSGDGALWTEALAGQRLFVKGAKAEAGPVQVDITTSSYYQGDTLEQTHRLDEDRSITLGINAENPAIEKALRGLGILAQDVVRNPTTGKPDPQEMQRRLDKALDLINDAIQHDTGSAELPDDMTTLAHKIGYNQVFVDQVTTRQETTIAFLETRIGEMENVDKTEAVMKLIDDARALEISYQSMARISQLSLANYI